ncbi:MAG: hypothetical protein ABSD89_01525 [Halobacteriota archaeon]
MKIHVVLSARDTNVYRAVVLAFAGFYFRANWKIKTSTYDGIAVAPLSILLAAILVPS